MSQLTNNQHSLQSDLLLSRKLSIKDSAKVFGSRSVKSIGTFMGLAHSDEQPLSLWKEKWVKKVQSGNTSMSLQVDPHKQNPLDQIHDTLSQLSRIGDSISTREVSGGDADLSMLEDIHINGHLIDLSKLTEDSTLSAFLQSVKNDGQLNEQASPDIPNLCDADVTVLNKIIYSEAVEPSPFVSCNDLRSEEANVDVTKRKLSHGSTKSGLCAEKHISCLGDDTCVVVPPSDGRSGDVSTNTDTTQVHVRVGLTDSDKLSVNSDVEHSCVYGREALQHYKLFREIEKRNQEEMLKQEKKKTVEKLQWQLKILAEIVNIGTEFFCNPNGRAAKKWKDLQKDVTEKCSTQFELQDQLGSLPVYFPYFTFFIVMVQFVTFIILISFGGVTTIGFETQIEVRENIKTFLGTETVDRLVIPNPWIGPSSSSFIKYGALYAPCMREDYYLNLKIVKKNYSMEEPLGCCEIFTRNTAGTTTEKECDTLTNGVGNWLGGTVCSERVSGNNSIAHNMKPCCVGIEGMCQLMSHYHCAFLNGFYHITGSEHCSQVNCLDRVCGMGGLDYMDDRPWIAESPSQWWRLLLSLIYNQGIVQLLFVCAGHLLLTRIIEPIAGWLRVAVIYVLSGISGLMAGAIFSPYQPHFGTTGALFGMVGVMFVEFLQSWKLVKKPYRELAKVLSLICVPVLFGTLPFISNFQLIFSLLSGILTSVIILPYVTFGHWNEKCRKILVGVCVPLNILLMFLLMFIFYKVQTLQNCNSCQSFECISYTNKLCFTG